MQKAETSGREAVQPRENLWPWNMTDEAFAARYGHLNIDLKPLFEKPVQTQHSTKREELEVAQQNA